MINAVSFEGRHRRSYRNNYRRRTENDNKTQITAGAIGGGAAIAARKVSKEKVTPESVIKQIIKDENMNSRQDLNKLNQIIKNMEENNINTLGKSADKLKNTSFNSLNANTTLEQLKETAKNKLSSIEANDRNLIAKKHNALSRYTDIKNKVETFDTQGKKSILQDVNQKLLENAKKAVIKLFHLTPENETINVDELKTQLKEQGKTLQDRMIGMKKEVTDKMENAKLLDINDKVSVALKKIAKSRTSVVAGLILLAIGGIGAYLLGKSDKTAA